MQLAVALHAVIISAIFGKIILPEDFGCNVAAPGAFPLHREENFGYHYQVHPVIFIGEKSLVGMILLI